MPAVPFSATPAGMAPPGGRHRRRGL